MQEKRFLNLVDLDIGTLRKPGENEIQGKKIASEIPVPHSLGKSFSTQ